MRIFVKQNHELKRQIGKKIAPLSARKELQENIQRELANAKNGSIQDRMQASREAAKWQKAYERNCPEQLSVDAKNAMWKRAKQLKDEFTFGMLTTDELHPVKPFLIDGVMKTVADADKMRTNNTVQRQLAWDNKNKDKVREYKNILRHLCPDNPAATDIEKFRRHGGIK